MIVYIVYNNNDNELAVITHYCSNESTLLGNGSVLQQCKFTAVITMYFSKDCFCTKVMIMYCSNDHIM